MCSSVVKIDSVNLDKVTYFINGVGLSSADVDVKTDIETNKVHIVTSKPKQSFCNVAVDDLPFQFEFKYEIEVDKMFDVSKTEVVAKNGFIIVTVLTAEGRITKVEVK